MKVGDKVVGTKGTKLNVHGTIRGLEGIGAGRRWVIGWNNGEESLYHAKSLALLPQTTVLEHEIINEGEENVSSSDASEQPNLLDDVEAEEIGEDDESWEDTDDS